MILDQITATPLDELTADDVAEVLERLKAIEDSEEVPVGVARFGSAILMATEEDIDALMALADKAPPGSGEAFNRNLDRLVDDHMDPERATWLLLAAQMKGEDVDAFTDHLLKLRAAFNGQA